MLVAATDDAEIHLRQLRGGPVTVLERGPTLRGESHGIASLLRELGIVATAVADADFELQRFGVTLIGGNANWYPRALEQLTAAAQSERGFVVIWHWEPLPYPGVAGLPRPRLHAREHAKVLLRDSRATDPHTNARRLRRLARRGLPDLLVVSNAGGREYLAEIGLRSNHVPLGYHPIQGRDLGIERDIDVVFIGALDVPRRKRALRALRRGGVAVEAAGGWGNKRVAGDPRTELLNRAKIVLNLSRHEGQFSGARLSLGMANRALVISEPMFRPEPFVPGVHYVEAPLDEMVGVVERYLADPEAREKIATRGHDFVTTELSQVRSLARIVELISGLHG
ncbi:MAG: glycosyltransferase family 1 protein [Thermoleophilia bacterium]|nr:glycosyltransferase family 1 protein [Thermoleophilia bacterium]